VQTPFSQTWDSHSVPIEAPPGSAQTAPTGRGTSHSSAFVPSARGMQVRIGIVSLHGSPIFVHAA
jgi:hypothetical protein